MRSQSRRYESGQRPTLHRPVTESGKNKTRFNTYRHGIWQDRNEHESFCKRILASMKPDGEIERQYAQTIADHSWRLNSAAACEANLVSLAIHERAEAIDSSNEGVDRALAEARAFREEAQAFAGISLYCQRLSRQRDKALEQEESERALNEAARLHKYHKVEEIPFNPAEYGFDFSVPEIEAHEVHKYRKAQAWEMRA